MPDGAVTRIEGLNELIRAFNKFDKDLAQDLVFELEEAADPVRKATTQYMLGELANVPATPEYAAMRIGVSKAQGLVYVAPAWRSRGGSRGRPRFGSSIQKRMERAVQDKASEVEKGMEKFLDRLADDWGK